MNKIYLNSLSLRFILAAINITKDKSFDIIPEQLILESYNATTSNNVQHIEDCSKAILDLFKEDNEYYSHELLNNLRKSLIGLVNYKKYFDTECRCNQVKEYINDKYKNSNAIAILYYEKFCICGRNPINDYA